MLRSSMFLTIALALMAMDSAITPASAYPSQAFSNRKEEILAHVHPFNSPGNTRFRPPSKKRA
jgi:hypothetical protein